VRGKDTNRECKREGNNVLIVKVVIRGRWLEEEEKNPEREKRLRGRGDKRTTQTSQTTQSRCVLGIGSLPSSPPESRDTQLCLRDGERDRERERNKDQVEAKRRA